MFVIKWGIVSDEYEYWLQTDYVNSDYGEHRYNAIIFNKQRKCMVYCYNLQGCGILCTSGTHRTIFGSDYILTNN